MRNRHMRAWHKERKWQQPIIGDLVYLVGSFGQRVGPASLVISVFAGGHTARVFCTNRGFASSHAWDDLEVVNESR